MDKEMKQLCYMGKLKKGFSAYSSPVMLISRKLTKDKRVVTDFRHLNVRIAKNNLAYPLVRNTFSMLGSSRCKVLSVLDLKDAIVDHLALMHIIKSKIELATTRIKRLLELISSYSFNLYYMKGKDMILSDFLSQQKTDDRNPHEIIPMSFNMYQVLENKFYLENNSCDDKYLIQTRSQAKSDSIKLPKVHGMKKNLNPNLRPE